MNEVKMFLRMARKNREANPKSWEALYETMVVGKVRKRYSESEENAIMRKKIAGLPGADEEFATYNAYAEACKAEAKAELGIGEEVT